MSLKRPYAIVCALAAESRCMIPLHRCFARHRLLRIMYVNINFGGDYHGEQCCDLRILHNGSLQLQLHIFSSVKQQKCYFPHSTTRGKGPVWNTLWLQIRQCIRMILITWKRVQDISISSCIKANILLALSEKKISTGKILLMVIWGSVLYLSSYLIRLQCSRR